MYGNDATARIPPYGAPRGLQATSPNEQVRKKRVFSAAKTIAFVTLFLQRIGLTIGGFPFPVSVFIVPVILIGLLMRGIAVISQTRVVLYGFILLSFVMSALITHHDLSLFSGILYVALYMLFLIRIDVSREDFLLYVRMIANIATFIAILGIVQYAIQYVVDLPFLFSWRDIVPEQFLIEYNVLNETSWGSGIYKANGFFMLEASIYSQLAARALILAIFILRDLRYLAPLGLAMLVAYSGTGLLLFILFGIPALIFIMWGDPRYRPFFAFGLMAAPVAIFIAWEPLGLQLFVDRLGEFGNNNSSAFARFVSGFIILDHVAMGNPIYLFFGNGPGVIDEYFYLANSDEFGSTWIKLLVEYGLFGLAAFCIFFWSVVRSSTQSSYLSTGFLLHFLFLDGGLLLPQQVATVMLLYGLVCCREPIYESADKVRKSAMARFAPRPARPYA